MVNNWNTKKEVYSYIKRILDIFLSLAGIVSLSPIMLVIAIMIKLDSKGPVIFKQIRTGKNGKDFVIYKFRTMDKDNDVYDKETNDKPTKFGKLLRKSGLDEIPQLFNILRGEMSFIGPRPWLKECYENMDEEQRHRTDVLPGITGFAQVNGRNKISILEKIDYDLEYINDYGLLMDIRTLLLTLKKDTIIDDSDRDKEDIHKEIDELKKGKVYYKERRQDTN